MDSRITILMVTIGATFWLVVALIIQLMPWLFKGGPVTMVLFIATIPVGWMFLRMMVWLADLSPSDYLPATAVTVATGTLLDGVFITWQRDIYGSNPEIIMIGAAWILWGIGMLLIMAMIMARQNTVN